MSEQQLTPDELSTQPENLLICEKLLGWVPCKHPDCVGWFHHDGKPCLCGPGQQPHKRTKDAPYFATWAEAGLILDALAARGFSYDLSHTQTESGLMQFGVIVWFPGKRYTVDADSLLVAIRAAALEYIKAVKS